MEGEAGTGTGLEVEAPVAADVADVAVVAVGPLSGGVRLHLVAGQPAGSSIELAAGVHHLRAGDGRRAVSISIAADGETTIRSVDVDGVMLDGGALSLPARWEDELLAVPGRIYRRAAAGARGPRRLDVDGDGHEVVGAGLRILPEPPSSRISLPEPAPPERQPPLRRWFARKSIDAERLAVARRRLGMAVEIARQDQVAYRRDRSPDLGELVERARFRCPLLWERRRSDEDALDVTVGWAATDWVPELAADLEHLDLADLVGPQPLGMLPVPFDLGGGLHVVGDREAVLDVARALLVQVVTLLGPSELSIALVTSEAHRPAWEGLRRLPHRVLEAGVDVPAGNLPLVLVDGTTPPLWAYGTARRPAAPCLMLGMGSADPGGLGLSVLELGDANSVLRPAGGAPVPVDLAATTDDPVLERVVTALAPLVEAR